MSLKKRFIPKYFQLFLIKKVSYFYFVDSFVIQMMRSRRLYVDSADALETTSHVATQAEDVDSSKGCWLIERMLTHGGMLTQAEEVKWSEGNRYFYLFNYPNDRDHCQKFVSDMSHSSPNLTYQGQQRNRKEKRRFEFDCVQLVR